MMATVLPSKVPNKIIMSNVYISMSLLENRRINTRASSANVAHIAHSQTGLDKPAETTTIAAEAQVAIANEVRRKST
jgi:hypothetical protein